ncbi:hypothetical protein DFW37_17920 [Clostridioides difficile]|nr:hypothetical protein [Clostridioides difficile]EGT4669072.1 hypothetical protein [Clostridioides difficile]
MSFKRFTNYAMRNFDIIDKVYPTNELQEKYYNHFMKKYSKIFKTDDISVKIEWNIRLHKTLKEIFTSSSFLSEAKYLKERNCFTSYYFLMYYSLFHSILALLYLDPNLDLDKLIDISHSKLIKYFENTYCKENCLVSRDIPEYFKILKELRELYSYSMPMTDIPLNYLFNGKKPVELLEHILSNNFQVANFHSIMIENSYIKNFNSKNCDFTKYIGDIYTKFNQVNCKKNPLNPGEFLISDADKNVRSEMIMHGPSIYFLGLDLEHFYDEYKTYNTHLYNYDGDHIDNSDAFNLIYNSLC